MTWCSAHQGEYCACIHIGYTYIHTPGGQSRSRLQQLVSWCGGEGFDGCLVFDECHKAKNFIPGQEQRSTKVALAVCMVQKLLPRARVVYCSATGVSGVRNMVSSLSHSEMCIYTVHVYTCKFVYSVVMCIMYIHVHESLL